MRGKNYWNEERELLERGDQSMEFERGVTSRATVEWCFKYQ